MYDVLAAHRGRRDHPSLQPDALVQVDQVGLVQLSRGETRFVSYVTLFAAADGYLTCLGDNGRALRVILLGDAFAKVDDATVAELMGLLVSFDLDFVMTGHALWVWAKRKFLSARAR